MHYSCLKMELTLHRANLQYLLIIYWDWIKVSCKKSYNILLIHPRNQRAIMWLGLVLLISAVVIPNCFRYVKMSQIFTQSSITPGVFCQWVIILPEVCNRSLFRDAQLLCRLNAFCRETDDAFAKQAWKLFSEWVCVSELIYIADDQQ